MEDKDKTIDELLIETFKSFRNKCIKEKVCLNDMRFLFKIYWEELQ